MQRVFDEFIAFQSKEKHFVVVFMMGITNHWTSFLAHKHDQKIEFWFFDSRNTPYINFSKEDIAKHLVEVQEMKRQQKKPLMNQFRMMCYENCINDIQESVRILCDCLMGNETLLDYTINYYFDIFGKHFLEFYNGFNL